MEGRKPSRKEKEYINQMYKVSEVAGLHVFNFFAISLVIILVLIYALPALSGEEIPAAMEKALSEFIYQGLFLIVLLLIMVIKSIIVLRPSQPDIQLI